MSDSPNGAGRAASLESNDSGPKDQEKKKSRRPPNTAFRQQRLKAWQPILTPKTVLPLFFAIGIIFAPIGGGLLFASAQVKEIKLDYSKCSTNAPDLSSGFGPMPPGNVEAHFKKSEPATNAQWAIENNVDIVLPVSNVTHQGSRCHLKFTIPEDMGPPVLFYYLLTNFYQNHRRYVDSFDADQLLGKPRTWSEINSGPCTPLKGTHNTSGVQVPYYPCGLIANSMFNDTYTSPLQLNPEGDQNSQPMLYHMENNSDIAWSDDKNLYGESQYEPWEVLPPPNWAKRYPHNYTTANPPPDLKTWQAFQVWMRTAGLPTFSKLYQRNDTHAMPGPGTYTIAIDDFFPTTEYKGTKSIVITTRTVIGGRNPFLGIVYIVVGGLCILLGAVFTVTHLFKPRKLGDHTYLSWNNLPSKPTGGQNTAMATGRDIRPGEA